MAVPSKVHYILEGFLDFLRFGTAAPSPEIAACFAGAIQCRGGYPQGHMRYEDAGGDPAGVVVCPVCGVDAFEVGDYYGEVDEHGNAGGAEEHDRRPGSYRIVSDTRVR